MKKKSVFVLADGLLLLVAIFWGSSYVATKSVVEYAPVFLFLLVRFAITAAVMYLPVARSGQHKWNRETWTVGVLLGVLMFMVYGLETLGIGLTTASNAGMLVCLAVVLTPLVEGLVLRKRPSAVIMFATGLSFFGAALLVLKEGYSFNNGDLLFIASALIRAVYFTATKSLTQGKTLDSWLLVIVQFGTVAVLAGVTCVFIYPASAFTLPRTAHFWLVTLYLCLFCTVFAFYVQTALIRKTTPTRVGLLVGTEPIFAAFFAIALLGETMGTQSIIGAVLLVAATYIGIRENSKAAA